MGVEWHLLCWYLLFKEVVNNPLLDVNELLFHVDSYWLCFIKRVFYLITSLKFRIISLLVYCLHSLDFIHPFFRLSWVLIWLKFDVIWVFNNLLHQLFDEDAVRVSLLLMLENKFSGRYPKQPLHDEYIALVFDLDQINR